MRETLFRVLNLSDLNFLFFCSCIRVHTLLREGLVLKSLPSDFRIISYTGTEQLQPMYNVRRQYRRPNGWNFTSDCR